MLQNRVRILFRAFTVHNLCYHSGSELGILVLHWGYFTDFWGFVVIGRIFKYSAKSVLKTYSVHCSNFCTKLDIQVRTFQIDVCYSLWFFNTLHNIKTLDLLEKMAGRGLGPLILLSGVLNHRNFKNHWLIWFTTSTFIILSWSMHRNLQIQILTFDLLLWILLSISGFGNSSHGMQRTAINNRNVWKLC